MNKKKKAILGTLLFSTILTGAYVHNQAFVGVEKRLTIKNPKVKDDLKITHISDFHSNVISNLDDVLKNIRAFNPDLIFLTGDMIDYPTDKKIERTMFFLENLSFRVALKYNIRLDLSIIAEKESGISFGSFPHSWGSA